MLKAREVAPVISLALLLAGCAASSGLQPPAAAAPAVREESSGSGLLYIADLYTSSVFVYELPALKFVHRLDGLLEPEGECADAAGDVWVADTGNAEMQKFKPGDKTAVASLADPLGFPSSCAVNPANGDLAVTDQYGNSGSGQLLVYKHAAGTPAVYQNAAEYAYYFDAYDGSGNLYTDGLTSKGTFVLSVLPAGKRAISTMTLSGGTVHDPGGLLWSGSSLVLGDQECNGGKSSCLYEASVSGRTATITATIALLGSCDVAQVALLSGNLYGGNDDVCAKTESTTDRWAFPAGGKPQASVNGPREPLGAAIGAP